MDLETEAFLCSLATLGRWRPSAIKILIANRPRQFDPELPSLKIQLEQTSVCTDIASYVSQRLTEATINTQNQARICEAVPSLAAGVFQYARLAIDRLLEPAADIGDVLSHLPLTLDCMYIDLLNEFAFRSGVSKNVQLQVLRWLTHAGRPLRLLEMADIMDFSNNSTDRDLERYRAVVRASCGPLIDVLPDETLSVSHYTVLDFLRWNRSGMNPSHHPLLDSTETQISLAKGCLDYLASGCLSFSEPVNGTLSELLSALQVKYPFARYAAENWNVHIARATRQRVPGETINAINDSIERVLESKQERQMLLNLTRWNCREQWSRILSTDAGRLHVAVSAGMTSYAQRIILQGADVNELDVNGDTPLHWAASCGQSGVAAVLLENGANPNLDDASRLKPLHRASSLNHADVVSLLLRAGADPMLPKTKERPGPTCNSIDHTLGQTPLYQASIKGASEVVNAFWPFIDFEQKSNTLRWAMQHDRPKLVRTILDRNEIDIDAKLAGNTLLFYACHQRNAPIIDLLLQAGADPNAVCDNRMHERHIETSRREQLPSPVEGSNCVDGFTPMHIFASSPCPGDKRDPTELASSLDSLIRAGGDIKLRDRSGMSMLHHACTHDRPALFDEFSLVLVSRLLEAGADANESDRLGRLPLHYCMTLINNGIVRLLVERGQADINKQDDKGLSPLIRIMGWGWCKKRLSNILYFLHLKPNCNLVNEDGDTALHLLLRNRIAHLGVRRVDNEDMLMFNRTVDALLSAGANSSLRNRRGQTPLHSIPYSSQPGDASAGTRGLKELLDLLISKGADPEARDHRGRTILFYAVARMNARTNRRTNIHDNTHTIEHMSILQVLLDVGCRIDVRDFSGRTLLHELVGRGGDEGSFNFLVAQGIDPDEVDSAGNTLLHEAVLAQKFHEIPHSHPVYRIPVQTVNHAGQTPLMIACQRRVSPQTRDSPLESLLPLLENVNTYDNNGTTALHMASFTDDFLVAKLLAAKADVSAVTKENLTALHLAVRSRNCNAVGALCEKILSSDPSLINARDDEGRTPLHHACRSGKFESVATLLRVGALRDVVDNNKLTPLSACAEYEEEQRLWTFHDEDHEHIWDISLRSKIRPCRGRQSPFGHPRQRSGDENDNTGIEDIIDLLVSHEDVSSQVDQQRDTMFSDAMRYALEKGSDYAYDCFMRTRNTLGKPDEIISFPVAVPSSAALGEWMEREGDDFDSDKLSLLLSERRYDLIRDIIAAEHDQGVLNFSKYTFMTCGYASLLEVTFQRETKINLSPNSRRSGENSTPLLIQACARELSNVEVFKVIAKQPGFLPDESVVVAPDQHGRYSVAEGAGIYGGTALHNLSAGKYWWHGAEGIPFLLDAGADIEARDEAGLTPLQLALSHKTNSGVYRAQVVRQLLNYGANVNTVTPKGRSCLVLANEPEIVDILVNHGAVLSVSGLFAAIEAQDSVLLEKLLSLGIDPNARVGREQPESPAHNLESLDWLLQGPGWWRGDLMDSELYPLYYATLLQRTGYNHPTEQRLKSLEIIRILLKYGADPYRTFPMKNTSRRIERYDQHDSGANESEEVTIVHEAFAKTRAVEPFLELSDLDVNSCNASGRTLFLVTCGAIEGSDAVISITINGQTQEQSLVEHVMSRGADVCAKDGNGNNALHICQEPYHLNLKTIELVLTKAPHLASEPNTKGDTPFHLALSARSTDLIDRMLPLIHDPTLPNAQGETPLSFVCRWIATTSRPRHASPEALAASEAAHTTNLSLFNRFRSLSRTLINLPDSSGFTPLAHYVSAFAQQWTRFIEPYNFHAEVADILVPAGADLKCVTHDGQTLLHLLAMATRRRGQGTGMFSMSDFLGGREEREEAADRGMGEIFAWLVERGGLDPWAEDGEGRTSLDLAEMNGWRSVKEMFGSGNE